MIKIIFCILGLLTFTNYCIGQRSSPGLDALLQNSEIIVEGTILKKYCRPPMDVMTTAVNSCVITMKVTRVIKGSPRLSTLDINQHIVRDPIGTVTEYDTIFGLCFEHYRMNIEESHKALQNQDATFYLDYDIKIGDSVIVFLKEGSDSNLGAKMNLPKDWIIYSLIDSYLGVITANDYVTEYLRNKDKEQNNQQK